MKLITTLLFVFVALQGIAQNYPDPIITVNNTTKEVKVTVKKETGMKPPLLTVDGFADPCGTFFYDEDSLYVATFKLVYAVPEPDTIKIQSVNFSGTGGTLSETVSGVVNTGALVQNGDVVGYYNVGDWLRYNSISLTGKKKIKFLYSYGLTPVDRKLEVRIGSIAGPLVAEMIAAPTTNWTTFVEKTIDINYDTSSIGLVDLYFVISGTQNTTPAYWGNLTGEIWFY